MTSTKRQKLEAEGPSYRIAASQLKILLTDPVTYEPEGRRTYYQATMRILLHDCFLSSRRRCITESDNNPRTDVIGFFITERQIREVLGKKRAQAVVDHADDRYAQTRQTEYYDYAQTRQTEYYDFTLLHLSDYLLQLQHLGYLDIIASSTERSLLHSTVMDSDTSVLVIEVVDIIVNDYLGTAFAASSIDHLIAVARTQDQKANVSFIDPAIRHQLHGRERFVRGTVSFHSRHDLTFGRTKEGNVIFSTLQVEIEELRQQWPAGCVHALTNEQIVPPSLSTLEMLSVLRCDMGGNSRDIDNVQVLSLEHIPKYWRSGEPVPPPEEGAEEDTQEKTIPTHLTDEEEHTLAAMLPQWTNGFPQLRYMELIMSTDAHNDYFCRIVYDREVDKVDGHPYLTTQELKRLERQKAKQLDCNGSESEQSSDEEEPPGTMDGRGRLKIGAFGNGANHHQSLYVYA